MRIPSKWWRWAGAGVVVLVVAALVVRAWVIPAVIVGQIRARYGGRVEIRDWWLNGTSAGVVGLALHEGTAADSPVWAAAERVATDLSLGGMLRGRFAPRRLLIRSPRITVRIDRDGHPLTRPPFREGGVSSGLPEVVAEGARVEFRQEGRPAMVVAGIGARLAPESGAGRLSARADDPVWGPLKADGRFDESFQEGWVQLSAMRVTADKGKAASIPFVPAEVWEHVVPNGPLGVMLTMSWGPGPSRPLDVRTVVTFDRTTLDLPTLGLVAAETVGRMQVRGGVVRLDGVKGLAIGGGVAAGGTLDFAARPPRFDLALVLDRVNVADAPEKWQLGEAGITGRLTGKARLKVALTDRGADLSGSSGEAVIEGGTIEGIAVKSLRLVMHAEGDDLKYEAGKPDAAGRGAALLGLVALQAAGQPKAKATAKGAGGFILPKSITTEVELEDVELSQVLAKGEALGIHLPVPVAGRLSLKARATIPLGKLRDLEAYAFHGDATLTGAHIAGTDFGRLTARLDLEDGVLDLKHLKGRLVDLPDGGIKNRPAPAGPVPDEGPLPPGGFRGRLRAALSPPGRLTARFEGNALPVGELAAPALPRPTPLSGLLTAEAKVEADVAGLADPKAWSASGSLRSERITYRGTTLDALSTSFTLANGRLTLPDVAARLAGKPLKANLGLGLAAPHEFAAGLDVTDWDLSDVLAFVPAAPRPSPIDGALTARAEARGTLAPRAITTQGQGRIAAFRAGPVPLGDVPFKWTTEKDAITLSILDARPFGGRMSGEATIPSRGDRPIEGTITLTGIDTAKLAAAAPGGSLALAGKADGRVGFVIPAGTEAGAAAVRANVRLSAPELTVQGLAARDVAAALQVREGVLKYDLLAESLGGKVKFQGEIPLKAPPPGPEAKAEVHAVGFALADLWRALGVGGAAANLKGLGAVDVNLRTRPGRSDLVAHGVAEVRDLSWEGRYPLGTLRGEFVLWPAGWRVEPLTGILWGGPARGTFWGGTPARGPRSYGFSLDVDQADLGRVLEFLPPLAHHLRGAAALRLAGRMDEALKATARVDVTRGAIFGLPLSELRVPAEVSYEPATGEGALSVRGWQARLAGGQVRGDARHRFGVDRAYRGEVHLAALDLATLVRTQVDVRRPASGKVTGRVTYSGPDPADLRRLRGKAVLDLDDASIAVLPVFRELDRFLGSASGALFEDGDLDATLANGQVVVEQFTLEGRAVQMHASGTVGFDTRLDLVVLVNTNQIVPETGQALVALIPGLGGVLNRREEALGRVANFLSNRLLKFRVTGTLSNPSVNLDPAVVVTTAAAGFFSGVLKLPLGILR
jgi:translocation and assembly module TamB